MAYNKKNFLIKVIEIQEITLEHTRRGITQLWVYKNIIRFQYHISKSSFDKYLARNAKKELKELELYETIF